MQTRLLTVSLLQLDGIDQLVARARSPLSTELLYRTMYSCTRIICVSRRPETQQL
jgi:hypothetical protein